MKPTTVRATDPFQSEFFRQLQVEPRRGEAGAGGNNKMGDAVTLGLDLERLDGP